MTQDIAPPVPIFKARLLRTKYDSKPNDTFSESYRSDISTDTLFGTDALLAME